MIVTTLVAAAVAAAEPAVPAQPAAAPAPAAEKKMACCDKMAKGEGCDCCKGMDGKAKDGHADHGEHQH
jgi:hypothetical protein